MTREESIAYIENYTWSTTRLGLERTFELLHAIGDPQKKLRFVHVSGSNGKGSTCAMLDSILREAGYRVGLYTSPYIQDFCERIQVNGQNIPGEDLAPITEQVRFAADAMTDHPSQFELVTAVAMLYFCEQNCDIVVLEVGMGGTLDSTNVIDAPEVAIITNIGLEHTEYLGGTLAEIASAKAGIIKPGCDCVLYDSGPDVRQVVEAVCRKKDVPLVVANGSAAEVLSYDLNGLQFRYDGVVYEIPLLGRHQVNNACVVLEAVAVLRKRGWAISAEAVQIGLREVTWPARMEILSREPLFILDGGHNPQCANALADSVADLLLGKKAVFLVGVLADKDYPKMLEYLLPLAKGFICLTPLSERALPAEDLASSLVKKGAKASAYATVEEGIEAALSVSGGSPIIAFGSLYLAGTVRTAFPSALIRWLRMDRIHRRNVLTETQREAFSASITKRLQETNEFQRAKNIMIYRAVRGEVMLDLLGNDKRFVYPQCTDSNRMVALRPESEDAWHQGRFGIMEPIPEQAVQVPPEELDLIVCPCTVFDEACHRIGMGGGFYDRFLPQCIHVRIIAVAYEVQKAAKIPTQAWDWPVDAVITEKTMYSSKTKHCPC